MGEHFLNKIDRKKYLLFTSAGDSSAVDSWFDSDRNFDIWVTYYGDNEFPFEHDVEYFNKRKGGKFPNLYENYRHYNEVFKQYDAIMVSDDDILITARELSKLFSISSEEQLDILQPAFDPRGKISYPVTKVVPFSYLRYTRFVEVTCPMFSGPAFHKFMEVYDPELICYGVDWWFLHVIGCEKNNVAIVDVITCRNPHDRIKAEESREIDRLHSPEERVQSWLAFKEKYKIPHDEEAIKKYMTKHVWYSARELRTSFVFAGIILAQKVLGLLLKSPMFERNYNKVKSLVR